MAFFIIITMTTKKNNEVIFAPHSLVNFSPLHADFHTFIMQQPLFFPKLSLFTNLF